MARILIVDDAKFMRTTMQAILTKDNHEIAGEAENGLEAVSLYKEKSPDLVIMDITMPVMNGIDAIKEIMKHDANAHIIVCSAMGHQKVVVDAIELGAKEFIVKPFDEHRVLEAVGRVLSYITN